MIDLHMHILPNIDDGAADIRIALDMLKMAADEGTKTVVATPHILSGESCTKWEKIVEDCHNMASLAVERDLNIRLCPGAEVFLDYDLLDILVQPGPYCLNGGKYILIELPAHQIPAYTDEFFFTLQTRGFWPILAHPERNAQLVSQPDRLEDWINKGILVQINGGSLLGQMGKRAMHFAERLVASSMVHTLGSDAHNLSRRGPGLRKAAKKLAALSGVSAAEEITVNLPRRILESQSIDTGDTRYLHNKKGTSAFLQRLWKNW